MPVLDNPRHERFAQEVAQGTSQREAYKRAGYESKSAAAADAAASRLVSDDKVLARIKEIQAVGARKAEVTTESILAELEEARLLALSLDQPAAAVAARRTDSTLPADSLSEVRCRAQWLRGLLARASVRQKKTADPVRFKLTEQTRQSVD